MLLSLATLKLWLSIANTADDTRLTSLINGVAARCDKYCDRKFERAVGQTEEIDPASFFTLRRFPVETLSLYYDTSRVFGSDTLLTASTDYVLNAATGQVWLMFSPSPTYPLSIKAVVTGGYVAEGSTPGAGQTGLPEDLIRALRQQCLFEWQNQKNFGHASVSVQGQSANIDKFDFLPEVKTTLDSYRRITF